MLLIDVMAGKTSDILEAMHELQRSHGRLKKTHVRVRAYVVGTYDRKKPIKKVIDIETLRKRRAAKKEADRILKARA